MGAAVNSGRAWKVAALLFGAALAIRCFHLGAQEFWLDELFSMAFLAEPWSRLFQPSTTLPHTPLYFALLSLLPRSSPEWVFRLPAALAGALYPAAVYLIMRRDTDEEKSIAAAVVLAIHPYLIYWSQEARMYALYGTVMAVMILMVAADLLPGFLWGIGAALGFYLFPYAVFFLPWFFWRAIRSRNRTAVVSLCVGFALILLWLVPAKMYLAGFAQFDTFERFDAARCIGLFKQALAGNFLSTRAEMSFGLYAALFVGAIGLGLAARRFFNKAAAHERRITIGAFSGLAFFLLATAGNGAYTNRAFYPISMIIQFLAVRGLNDLASTWWRRFLYGMLLAAFLFTLGFYFDGDQPYNRNTPRSQRIEPVAAVALPGLTDSDAVVFTSLEPALGTLRYFPPTRATLFFDREQFHHFLMPFEEPFFTRLFERLRIRVASPDEIAADRREDILYFAAVNSASWIAPANYERTSRQELGGYLLTTYARRPAVADSSPAAPRP